MGKRETQRGYMNQKEQDQDFHKFIQRYKIIERMRNAREQIIQGPRRSGNVINFCYWQNKLRWTRRN